MEELQPERSLSYSPLFQVMFVLQNAPSTGLELEGLSVSRLRVGAETAKFDLTLSMHETVEGLSGSLQYNTDLFDDATITRILGHFATLLEGIVKEPTRAYRIFPFSPKRKAAAFGRVERHKTGLPQGHRVFTNYLKRRWRKLPMRWQSFLRTSS